MAKLEYLNPAGSVKDRAAKSMIDDAEARGLLKNDSVIIEPTAAIQHWACCNSGCTRLQSHIDDA